VVTTCRNILISETPYDRVGRKHGVYVNFFENGNKYDEISYICDQKDGPARRYDAVGNMIHESIYRQNKLHGLCREWFVQKEVRTDKYMQTQLMYEYTYENDERKGICKGWSKPGVLSLEAAYDGTLHGPCREWYDTGALRVECTYNRGKLDGLYKKWHVSGRWWKERIYTNGKYDRNVICYAY
jgi:antitoxin component YwqK of YwqJK toxin-antitoxin module